MPRCMPRCSKGTSKATHHLVTITLPMGILPYMIRSLDCRRRTMAGHQLIRLIARGRNMKNNLPTTTCGTPGTIPTTPLLLGHKAQKKAGQVSWSQPTRAHCLLLLMALLSLPLRGKPTQVPTLPIPTSISTCCRRCTCVRKGHLIACHLLTILCLIIL